MSKRSKMFLNVITDETGAVADVLLIKQARQYDPRAEKSKDFRRHGNKCATRRYWREMSYYARFAEERRVHDGYGKERINATAAELEADAKEYNHICALREVIALGDQAIAEIQNFWAWN